MTITRVGVLGAGPLAQAFARALARAGIATVIGSGRAGEVPSTLLSDLEGMAATATLRDAAEEDIVFLSVPWSELEDTLAAIADWESRILIDATNPIPPGLEIIDLGGRTSSEIVSDLSPGAQLVKAFNTLPPEALVGDPRQAGGRRVVFFSGDHVRAKVEVGRLIAQLGFAGVDLGNLASGGRLQQFPDGPLWRQNLVRVGEFPPHSRPAGRSSPFTPGSMLAIPLLPSDPRYQNLLRI
jgi:predicted dinucleotide-binding enzyme